MAPLVMIYQGNVTLGDDTHFPLCVAVLALMVLVSQDAGFSGIFRGGFGSWLLALLAGSWLWRNILHRHWVVAYGSLVWLLALAVYSAEALACGFWSSYLDLGSGGIFHGGTGLWLLVFCSGSFLEGRDFFFKRMCSCGVTGSLLLDPCACTVNNVDANCQL